MPLTATIALVDFWNKLPIDTLNIDLAEAMQSDRTQGGEQLTADLGERLWRGEVTFGRLTYAEAAAVEVLLDVLRQSGRFFFGTDIRRRRPLADPNGTILGAATPTVSAIPNNRDLTIAGLPAAYVLTPGDWLGFVYDGATARRGFHRVVDGGTASGGGVLTVEVVPALRAGLLTGTSIVLSNPLFKARVTPGSSDRGDSRRLITQGGKFSFEQTLR
jgi:hypothetical protein